MGLPTEEQAEEFGLPHQVGEELRHRRLLAAQAEDRPAAARPGDEAALLRWVHRQREHQTLPALAREERPVQR